MDPDPDFSGSNPVFWPNRIRAQKKKSDPDPGKKPGSETLIKTCLLFNVLKKVFKCKF